MDGVQPQWPAPPGVRAWCSTRAGGVSAPPYDSMNLGDHVGDDSAAVQANRSRFAGALDARPVFLQQVHGSHTAVLGLDARDGLPADACVTTERGLACTIMVADCLPVLLCDAAGRAVAAAHAGWRGLAGAQGQGILESVVARLQALARAAAGAQPSEILAWLGPCIGPDAFEVGPEVKAAFEAQDAGAAALFRRGAPGKWLADLPGLARRRLQALGVTRVHGNDGGAAWCTVGNPSRFFSHRRDRLSGRFAASIWLA
ncbi:peptidoglycan editing factor PgeF [Ramlibacter tataouinensis]|uniref:Purine nucleoside phosphorylase n=1 Tax=Ramlibacter tataouinensis (strain ATCC BAA-407 / DSM 14655 / LMG 21543 / TTB310) TaxID=365046 RepID=F5XWE4_RAMTT|nr:peptidoglycan editing factor PgeF [Ramlibacter tataouinensis]AEG92898.1 conserved hypothetical protein [Ramlibacter tataouinensis TTB310]